MNVLGLVQLCEVAHPLGGYSHSLGIDALAKGGGIRSPEQLCVVVNEALHSAVGPLDGIASGIAFRASRQGDFGAIGPVCEALSSQRMLPDMRIASVQMGQRLWALSRRWEWAGVVHEQLDEFAARRELHHAVAFGVLVAETTSNQVRAIATDLFNIARGLIETAVRVVPLPEVEGQRVLATVQPTIAELATRYVDKHPADILRP